MKYIINTDAMFLCGFYYEPGSVWFYKTPWPMRYLSVYLFRGREIPQKDPLSSWYPYHMPYHYTKCYTTEGLALNQWYDSPCLTGQCRHELWKGWQQKVINDHTYTKLYTLNRQKERLVFKNTHHFSKFAMKMNSCWCESCLVSIFIGQPGSQGHQSGFSLHNNNI